MPKLIGISGYPTAGKSETQNSLQKLFGVVPIDDGWPLRQFAMEHLGADEWHVRSQTGKREKVKVIDTEMEWRQFLGRLGNALEREFGEHIMPFLAVENITAANDDDGAYSFGSVRKTQGVYFRKLGGYILEVINPSVGPSGNDFDLYDRSLTTHSLLNEGKSIEALDEKVMEFGLSIGLVPSADQDEMRWGNLRRQGQVS